MEKKERRVDLNSYESRDLRAKVVKYWGKRVSLQVKR